MTDADHIGAIAASIDGAMWHCEVLRNGPQPTRHGSSDRWDWGLTVQSLQASWQRDERYTALAKSLTSEQRTALWQVDTPQTQLLRRYVQRLEAR